MHQETRWGKLLLLGGILFFAIYFLTPPEISILNRSVDLEILKHPVLHLASIMLEVALAIFVINVTLQRSTQQQALAAFDLHAASMTKFLELVERCGSHEFGDRQFREILQEFAAARDNRHAIRDDLCCRMAQVCDTNASTFGPMLARIREDLKELAQILGWSYDPALLARTFLTRNRIEVFETSDCQSDTEGRRTKCKFFLDVYISVKDIEGRLRTHS